MRWFHLSFGVLVFAAFTVTGRYMRLDFPDKEAIPQELRILMRSRHIYILFSGLIHLALGVYMHSARTGPQRMLQYSGSLLLTAASSVLLWAFIVESYELAHFSDISRYGIYASLAGIGFHLVGGLNARPGSVG